MLEFAAVEYRGAIFALGMLSCGPKPSTVTPAEPAEAPEAEQPEVPAEEPPAPDPIDIESAAAGEEIVFMHTRSGCEAWQFVQGGERLEVTADESIGLRLSYRVTLRGPTQIVLDEPRGQSPSATVDVDCPDGPPNRETLYVEESDCRAGIRSVEIKRGCPDALLDDDERAKILHRLESMRSAAIEARRAEAPTTLKAFRKAIKTSKGVWMVETNEDGTRECARWRLKKNELVRTFDHGGRATYGYDLGIGRRSGFAEVTLSGPGFSDENGKATGGFGSFDHHPITELTVESAKVGDETWYFSAAACEAGASRARTKSSP